MREIEIADFEWWMLDDIVRLFYDTVHTINARDYNEEQLERWAPAIPDVISWKQRLGNNVCKVAMVEHTITGFAELTSEGHVDTMYVHKNFQGRGIAKKLMDELLKIAHQRNYNEISTEASITAKPLFEKYGFVVKRVKTKLHNGKGFINYEMTKVL